MKYINKLQKADKSNSSMMKMLGGPGPVQRNTTQRDIIRINFTAQGIGTADEHMEELDAIRSAGPDDILILYFTGCGGGVIDTGMSLINALIETPAHTVAVLEGYNASLATMVPLVCREIIVTSYTSMMLHSAHGGTHGTMLNQERSAIFFSKMLAEFMSDIYHGFVTEQELQDLKNGLEIYLGADEIEERLEKRAKLMTEEMEKELEALEKTNAAAVEVAAKQPKKKAATKKVADPKKKGDVAKA